MFLISGIEDALGNLFGGNNDDQQKKKQQQPQTFQPNVTRQVFTPTAQQSNANQNQPQSPSINLFQGPQKAQPNPAAAPQPQQQPQQQPSQPQPPKPQTFTPSVPKVQTFSGPSATPNDSFIQNPVDASSLQKAAQAAAPKPTPNVNAQNDPVDNFIGNAVRGAVTYLPNAAKSVTYDPLHATIAQMRGDKAGYDQAMQDEANDNPFAPVVAAGNQLSSALVAPTVEANADKLQKETTDAFMQPYGNTPAGRAYAEARGAEASREMLDNFGAQNGFDEHTSPWAIAGNALLTQSGITAPLALAGIPEGMEKFSTGLQKAPVESGISAPEAPAIQPAASPDTVESGIKSVNPTREADAAQQVAAQAQQAQPAAPAQPATPVAPSQPLEVDNTPSYMRQQEAQAQAAATRQAETANYDKLGVGGSPLDQPAFQHRQAIQATIAQGERELNDFASSNPQATPQEIEAAKQSIQAQVVDQIQKLNDARYGAQPAAPAEAPVTPQPAIAPQEVQPAAAPQVQPAAVEPQAPAPAPIQPAAAAPTAPAEPVMAMPESNRMAPNAPNVRDQIAKLNSLGEQAGDPTMHDVLSNDELNQAAQRTVQSTPPEQILSTYSGVPKLQTAADLAHAKASMPVLAQLTHSEDAAVAAAARQAIDNIMEGAEKGVSNAGRTMNYAQSMYDSLPKEAKISLTIRTLDKARDAAGMPKIADDVKLRAQVEATLDNLLSKGEDLQNQLAAVQGKIEDIMAQPKTPEARQQLDTLGKQQADLTRQSGIQNRETARFYDSLVPGKAALQKAAEWARTSMLTAPTGRLNNGFNVGGSAAYELLRSIPQTIINKGINLVKGPGTVTDSSLLRKGLATGAKEGFKNVKAAFSGAPIDSLDGQLNPQKAAGNYGFSRTLNNNGVNKIVNGVQALVKAPSEVIGGALKQAQLERLAEQEGLQNGLKGDDLKTYTQARSLIPSKQMVDNANLLKDQISHMNKNPFADFAGRMFGDTSRLNGNAKGAASLLIKNVLLPFPKYAATFAWNTLTDRNVVADTVRLTQAAMRGDAEGISRAIAGAAVDGTLMYVGYQLTQQGVITNTDAQGYNDSGAYLHLGNRYIPLGSIGVGAEGLIAGNAIHNAVTSATNPTDAFFKTVGDTVLNTIKSGGAQSVLGAGNQTLTTAQDMFKGANGVTLPDFLATYGNQAAGQFIPGVTSDVNAVLNQTPLNPTHEAADTKVTKGSFGEVTKDGKPSTAKDIPRSELNSLINRIPVASQMALPRKAGVAAPDLIDRATRGSQSTPTEEQAAAVAKTKADQSAYDKANGIPDPNGTFAGSDFNKAVEARIQNGDYDKAIAALQQDLSQKQGNKDIPKSDLKSIQDKITETQVLKNGGYDPSIRDLYKNTSLADWRNMGDPTSDTYDPKTYQTLYQYGHDLAAASLGGTKGDPTDNKFYAKGYNADGTPNKRGGSGSKSHSNTIGSVPLMKNISFGNLAPRKVTSAKIPTIQMIPPSQLIKARSISVNKGV